jgi:molybdopterin-containing oxidoreductase family iron-sulfur binding subunit
LVIGGTVVGLGTDPLIFTKLIPFVSPPEQLVPGVSTWYATSCRECPAGCGLLARNREGRVIKVEGNPLHPVNCGTLCARGQAGLQGLYDPDRIKRPRQRSRGRVRAAKWREALREIGSRLASIRSRAGQVAVISDLQEGSLAALIRDWLKAFGSDRYLVYEPFNYEPLREANRLVFGVDGIPDYRLDEADFVLSLCADFVETWISPAKWIRRYASRRVPGTDGRISKFVYAGPLLALTAMNADEFLPMRPGDERLLALSLLHVLRKERLVGHRGDRNLRFPSPGGWDVFAPERASPIIGVPVDRITNLARQLARAKSPLVLAGPAAPAGEAVQETAVAADLLNHALAATAVDFGRLHALGATARAAQIARFVEDLGSGKVEALIVIGANPGYSLPPGYRFAEAVRQVPLVVSLSSFADETAELAQWVLPSNAPIESWGDYEPETGIANLMQPAMGTRYNTRPAGDILLSLAAAAGLDVRERFGAATFYDYLRGRWAARERENRTSWEDLLARGGAWSAEKRAPTALPPLRMTGELRFSPPQSVQGTALWPYPSTLLFDGRGANKRWLQEIPDALHHAVWMSWCEMNQETAAKLGVQPNEVAELATRAGKIAAPVFVYPGVAADTIAIPFGQGHTAYGRYARGRGANAFQLLEAKPGVAPYPAVRIGRRLGRERVVTTDFGLYQDNRRIIEIVPLSRLAEQRPARMDWPLPKGYGKATELYPPHPDLGHRWAMAIDLSRCVGCEACVAACYAENNVAIVGKQWVRQGREMSWIRIDRYYTWGGASPAGGSYPAARFLVMLCQQCDAAPCEPVCPVFASSHSKEGLNAQIYNRCVGTRYCSNNCPYKVRRFNWRNYDWPESLTWQLNPNVTVRTRGVMEKCTFCIQRINEVELRAKKEGRPVRDGEITPACVQTCPARAFVFGDLLDPRSQVSRLVKDHPRRFQSLQSLNTRPAVFYLKKIVNDGMT